MKKSYWDNSILKKYSSVSHSRLLSQLLAELKAYPLPRNVNQSSLSSTNQKTTTSTVVDESKSQLIQDNNSSQPTNVYSNIDTINEK